MLTPAGPSGASRRISATLQEGGSAWRIKLGWAEAGEYRVDVTLGSGAHVGGSPFVVTAEPTVVFLGASAIEGAGLQEARPAFIVQTCSCFCACACACAVNERELSELPARACDASAQEWCGPQQPVELLLFV